MIALLSSPLLNYSPYVAASKSNNRAYSFIPEPFMIHPPIYLFAAQRSFKASCRRTPTPQPGDICGVIMEAWRSSTVETGKGGGGMDGEASAEHDRCKTGLFSSVPRNVSLKSARFYRQHATCATTTK